MHEAREGQQTVSTTQLARVLFELGSCLLALGGTQNSIFVRSC